MDRAARAARRTTRARPCPRGGPRWRFPGATCDGRGAYHRLTSIVRWGGPTRGLRGCARHRLLEPDLGRARRARRRTSGGKRPRRGRHSDGGPFDVSDREGEQMTRERTPFTGETATQMHHARRGVVTPEMRRVAEREEVAPEYIRDEVARGRMVIPANVHHASLDPMGIGINAHLQDQREHRQLRGALQRRAGAGEAALRRALRRGHRDGPVDGRRHRRDPHRDHRRVAGAHRHGADLPGRPGGDAGRGPDRGRPHRR